MIELLPSFIIPNDPAVDRVLKAASDVLRRAGKNDALDGYESKSRTRVWEITSALWTAVCNLNISYALPQPALNGMARKFAHRASFWKEKSRPVWIQPYYLLQHWNRLV